MVARQAVTSRTSKDLFFPDVSIPVVGRSSLVVGELRSPPYVATDERLATDDLPGFDLASEARVAADDRPQISDVDDPGGGVGCKKITDVLHRAPPRGAISDSRAWEWSTSRCSTSKL